MFEFIFSMFFTGSYRAAPLPARKAVGRGCQEAKVIRMELVNNLWKTSEKFSLPRVAQIQLPICHLPNPANFRKDALPKFLCEAFVPPAGNDYNQFQSNIL